MTYKQLGLGALIVDALRTAVRDPELEAKVEEASAGLEDLRGRLSDVVSEMTMDDKVDSDQSEALEGIQAELDDLASALTPALSEVEEPAAEVPAENPAEPTGETPSEPVPEELPAEGQ